jgi:hypothetical protein
MRFRKLRIAWSVGWGVVALLLIALWVNSYGSNQGWNTLTRINHRILYYLSLEGVTSIRIFKLGEAKFSLNWERPPDVVIHHWNAVLISAAIATLPWLPIRRFSLRTLLIAMTLVAAVLGLIVYASR